MSMAFFSWFADRLREPTTWLGLDAVLSSVGIVVDPELSESIKHIGLGFAGVVLFVMREKK